MRSGTAPRTAKPLKEVIFLPFADRALESLLDDVVDDPALNTRDQLLERARAEL